MRETRDRVASDRARWSPLETYGRMTLVERQRAGTVPLSPATSGERAEAGGFAGRGRGAAACSEPIPTGVIKCWVASGANGGLNRADFFGGWLF